MSNKYRIVKSHALPARKEWPAVTYVGIFAGAFVGYGIARIALNTAPHPYHWLGGLIGAILGCCLGWIWFRLHGDIWQ